MQDANQVRESWATSIGFILAASGSAVGLGNIWRFPYMVGEHGGAAFLLIYLIAIVLIGYPVMINEITLGRKTHRNPVGAFKSLAPGTPWWLVGALGVLTGFVILSYYSVIAGWSLAYIYKVVISVTAAEIDHSQAFMGHITSVWEPIGWHALFMILTVAIIATGVVRGIQRWVTILMPAILFILLALVLRAVTLPGAGEGLSYYLQPDLGEITWRSFLAAIGQAFFTLSLGMGAIITYGSYLREKDEIPGKAASVVGLDTGIALMAGLAIFPAVFALGFSPGEGPGLVFITLPAVFAEMPLGSVFGILFFVLLSIAALTSAISLLEVVTAWLIDEWGWSRAGSAVLMGSIIFLVGLPTILGYSVLSEVTFPGLGTDILDTYDWFAYSIFLPLGALLTAIFVGYIWGARQAAEEANKSKKYISVGYWWIFLIRYVVPVLILVVMFMGIYDTFAGN